VKIISLLGPGKTSIVCTDDNAAKKPESKENDAPEAPKQKVVSSSTTATNTTANDQVAVST
jgi:hypothetical protein